jgi:hypothetical protein
MEEFYSLACEKRPKTMSPGFVCLESFQDMLQPEIAVVHDELKEALSGTSRVMLALECLT